MLKCCIYKLINKRSNDFYIGKTINLQKRKYRHFSSMKCQTHSNKYIQSDYNNGDSFYFETILLCEQNELKFYEQKCIDIYKPPYNICIKNCENKTDVRGYKHPNASSNYIGVYFDPAYPVLQWTARLWHQGKSLWLGNYITEKEAAVAVDKKSIELFEVNAKLNFDYDFSMSYQLPLRPTDRDDYGVYWDKFRHKWVAKIKRNSNGKYLGRFDNIEDAITARKNAEEKYNIELK